jgi:hypothetical protein
LMIVGINNTSLLLLNSAGPARPAEKLGNKCRGSPDETERYALWVRRNDEVRHLFPPLASGCLGFAGLAVDFFDGDILTADSAADGDVALARLLAQRDFLDHMSLLG